MRRRGNRAVGAEAEALKSDVVALWTAGRQPELDSWRADLRSIILRGHRLGVDLDAIKADVLDREPRD